MQIIDKNGLRRLADRGFHSEQDASGDRSRLDLHGTVDMRVSMHGSLNRLKADSCLKMLRPTALNSSRGVKTVGVPDCVNEATTHIDSIIHRPAIMA
jgi:hypothetical protein